MVRRLKHGPVNAAKVLPPALVTALQQVAAGRHVYIPAVESPVVRRWREARRYQQLGYPITRIAQQLELYVPVAVSKTDQRRRRIAGLFIRGWTLVRVAAHLQMSARQVARLYQAWKAEQEQQGRTVIPGQPLYSVEDRRRAAAEREQRRRARLADQQRRAEQARQRAIFGDEGVEYLPFRPVPLD